MPLAVALISHSDTAVLLRLDFPPEESVPVVLSRDHQTQGSATADLDGSEGSVGAGQAT